MPEHGTIPFFINDDVCHTGPFALKEYCLLVIERSTNPSIATKRCPIVDILSFISVDMVFNCLSNVRLLGIFIRPQASASLWV